MEPPLNIPCLSFQPSQRDINLSGQDNYQDNFIRNDTCQSGVMMKLKKKKKKISTVKFPAQIYPEIYAGGERRKDELKSEKL